MLYKMVFNLFQFDQALHFSQIVQTLMLF